MIQRAWEGTPPVAPPGLLVGGHCYRGLTPPAIACHPFGAPEEKGPFRGPPLATPG